MIRACQVPEAPADTEMYACCRNFSCIYTLEAAIRAEDDRVIVVVATSYRTFGR